MIAKPSAQQSSGAVSRGSASQLPLILRLVATLVLVGGYYWFEQPLAEYGAGFYSRMTGQALDAANRSPRIIAATAMMLALVAIWWRLVKTDPRYQGPLLVTTILVLGDAAFGILESHTLPEWLRDLTGGQLTSFSPTFVTIVVTIVAELFLGRFFWGKLPHLASSYISGISAGILIKSPELWPFVMCALISITSKYVLRIGNRHIWNPTNFGVSMMLFLAPASVASLSVQAGNNGWAVLVIWLLGGMIMYRLGLWHIPLTFIAAFVPLAVLRSYALDIMEPQRGGDWQGHSWLTELAPITSPMFQLFIFFMITDPKTIVRGKSKQVFVVLLVAVMETILRLAFKDIYSLFHALFIVGPVANLIEIYVERKKKSAAAQTKAPAEAATSTQIQPKAQNPEVPALR
jgi:hypothetical protein